MIEEHIFIFSAITHIPTFLLVLPLLTLKTPHPQKNNSQ